MDEALTISGLRDALTADQAAARLQAADTHGVWIHRLDADALTAHRARIEDLDRANPLWGVPFAIKDHIDLAGAPTTAGCPRYAYTPQRSATVVERPLAAGAIPVGKTNMDQFATGLVGTRSPYGATANALDPDYISGGSSSGSVVAVKLGLAAFALGTDTAGSGRVPAAFNGLVGFKPTKGLVVHARRRAGVSNPGLRVGVRQYGGGRPNGGRGGGWFRCRRSVFAAR